MTRDVDQSRPLNEEDLRRAVEVANVPTLLMVLFQLTGDEAWLQAPYLPTRTRGLDLHDSGGLADDVQQEVRSAAIEALIAWSNGTAPVVPAPESDLLVQMMSVCMGEAVDTDYAPMMAEDMGFISEPVRRPANGDLSEVSAIVIGAGVSGLLASAKLTQAGIRHIVLEKNNDVGGTWLNNRYPGCGVDTPSYLYTFSFLPNDWSTYFGKRNDVWKYFADAARSLGVYDRIKFGAEVVSAEYNSHAREWIVTARERDGHIALHKSSVVISAVGQLNVPHIPNIDGSDKFTGEIFHSAEWPAHLDVTGKRVAVIGTGASAMQIVPAIADSVEELTVYQRSPQWIAPSSNYFDQIPEGVHWLMNHVPFYRAWYRFRLAWTFNDKAHASLHIDPSWPHQERSVNVINDGYRGYFTRHLSDELSGRPDLIEKSLPTYPPYGKRMLLDNGWYRALRRPSVNLVTESIVGITAAGVVTESGYNRPVDVIVYATGFEARRMVCQFDVRGEAGQSLRDVWGDENAYAYLGITVPGFPNFFLMYGPNTNTGHGGSYIWVGECQIRYIVDLICSMVERGVASVDCRDEVCAEYNHIVDRAHREMLWTHGGMRNWYRNAQGRVVTNSPWRVADYWRMTHAANLDDFVCESTTDSPSAEVPKSVQNALHAVIRGTIMTAPSFPRRPKFETPDKERTYRKQRLAAGFRLFAKFGFEEGIAGHITARDPIETNTFWVNPFVVPFSHVRQSDLIRVNEEGEIVEGNGRLNQAAFAIHSRVHAARPDVIAAAHSHSTYGRAMSTLGQLIEPLTQDACAFYRDHALFDDYTGVVVELEEGKRIADALGGNKAVILRNHGLLTVGQSVDSAVFWFITLERSCQVQLAAKAAGAVIPIDEYQAAKTYEQVGSEKVGWLSFQPLYNKIIRAEPDLLDLQRLKG